jgi:3-methylcrotonyl-CoA carboxylase alpha subunit
VDVLARVRLLSSGTDSGWRLSIDGEAVSVRDSDEMRLVQASGSSYRLQCEPPLSLEETARDRGAVGAAGRLTAPMPGRIVKLSVERGQHVDARQPLVVLEAMKMEHVVEAPYPGTVIDIFVRLGDQVANGARLLTIGSE